MFWIKTCDGELINMDHCDYVYVREWSKGTGRYVVTAVFARSDSTLDIFRGKAEECGRYRDDLFRRMNERGIGFDS